MRILLTGATGFLGRGVLQTCLDDADAPNVVALVRRPTGRTHARLTEVQVDDFAALDGSALPPVEACFYCAGALPVGTGEAEYRRVTVDLTLHVARVLAETNPALRFLYVSGAHSDPSSALMPFRVKGEAEAALAALPIASTMLRPGGILPADGVRSPRAPLALLHSLTRPLHAPFLRLMPGLTTTTGHVGRAMLALARMPDPPRIVENAEINRIGAD